MVRIILLIIIIIIIYLILFVKKKDLYHCSTVHSYQSIKDHLGTGDIILFSCQKHEHFFNSIEYYFRTHFVGSEYGHAGIIIKDNDELYLLECNDSKNTRSKNMVWLNNRDQGGVRLAKFEEFIKKYHQKNDAVFGVRLISQKIPNQILLDNIMKYQKITFLDKKIAYLLAILDNCVSHDLSSYISKKCDPNRMMCTEFLHHFLNEIGIVSNYPSKLFWPHRITDGTLDSLLKIKYSPPIKFKFF